MARPPLYAKAPAIQCRLFRRECRPLRSPPIQGAPYVSRETYGARGERWHFRSPAGVEEETTSLQGGLPWKSSWIRPPDRGKRAEWTASSQLGFQRHSRRKPLPCVQGIARKEACGNALYWERAAKNSRPIHSAARVCLCGEQPENRVERLTPPGRPGPDLPGCRRYARCRWKGG